jgi:hypothetical protein
LRIAEKSDEVGHPVQGKINGMFGPAGDDLLLDLAHPGLDIHSSSLLGQAACRFRTAGRQTYGPALLHRAERRGSAA